jgi:hypothetical protein
VAYKDASGPVYRRSETWRTHNGLFVIWPSGLVWSVECLSICLLDCNKNGDVVDDNGDCRGRLEL